MLQNPEVFVELYVVFVIVPSGDGNSIFLLVEVGHWAIIYYYRVTHIAPQVFEVLYIDATPHACAVLSEEACRNASVRIDLVQERICILRERCGKDD